MQTPPNETVRVHIRVRGRVQGVGFRAHVEYFALQIGVRGWVRNIGRDVVEAVAEGSQAQIEQFIEMMKTGPSLARVEETKLEYQEPTGEFEAFTVKRSM
jgi:acylphosphatase